MNNYQITNYQIKTINIIIYIYKLKKNVIFYDYQSFKKKYPQLYIVYKSNQHIHIHIIKQFVCKVIIKTSDNICVRIYLQLFIFQKGKKKLGDLRYQSKQEGVLEYFFNHQKYFKKIKQVKTIKNRTKQFIIQMENNRCNLPKHASNPFNFLCVDPSCKYTQKYACLGCIAFYHPGHMLVEYNDVYAQINQGSQETNQPENETLEEFIEKKRMYTMSDICEVVKLLDMVQFQEAYSNNSNGNNNKSSNLLNLQNKYNDIKSKPFHSMNSQELNTVIELYNTLQNSNQTSNQQNDNQQLSEKKQKINKILNDNKKNIMIFINTYREQIEEGKEPISYQDALQQIQKLKQQQQQQQQQQSQQQQTNQNEQIENLNKQISQLKSQNAQLKEQQTMLQNENTVCKDDLQVANVKLQSVKEMNEQLRTRLQTASKNADNTTQFIKLQNVVDSLRQELSTSDNKYNNLQKAYKEQQQENEELKEVLIKARIALEIYQSKFQQLTQQVEQNKRESVVANLRAAIIAAENDERRKQEIRRQQAQQGRVEVTECNVQ
ncbi:hypothetical protein TTHERM_00050570 (macronuclear) [Tetrahymena thermophila SB210]|uniref:Uncharacterized protein n=1 Tax=Tetrahymena thermophila (strain SB210) TaxID=312017 RepID=Q23D33_TETTS|nr:hypothetical protein TTHERM_00050570 [Tetrahymena thermophila SB210]EAR94438.3 hypothetical protein TTHERM_00050570 [Tetrahymena thermophila SB210]|eukprot:XP_001014853.3 hypothetical protein TTHERM_00050570 [Tetrahymena thermophila SB210]